MSPEQAMGNDVDHRSDLFSLGSVMYFMATGREPFRADKSWAVLQKIITQKPASPRSINSDVPLPLEKLILRLMEQDPKQRFPSATEAQESMQEYLAHLQNPKVHKLPNFETASMKSRLLGNAFSFSARRWPVLLAASLLIGTGVAGLFNWIPAGNAPRQRIFDQNIGPAPFVDAIPVRRSPLASQQAVRFGSAFDADATEIDRIKIALDRLENPKLPPRLQAILADPFQADLETLSDDVQSLETQVLDRK